MLSEINDVKVHIVRDAYILLDVLVCNYMYYRCIFLQIVPHFVEPYRRVKKYKQQVKYTAVLHTKTSICSQQI